MPPEISGKPTQRPGLFDYSLPCSAGYGTKVEVTLLSRRPASRCPRFGLAVLVVAIGISRHARADELRLTLSYHAPPECPSAKALQSAVLRLATAQTKPYSASVVIDRKQERFTARIISNDGTERTLVGSTCDELAEATAVVLALAISPSNAAPEATNTNRFSEINPRQVNPPLRKATSSSGVQLKLGASGVLDWGTMPGLDLAFAGRIGTTARTWSAAVEGSYWLLSESRALSQNSNIGGNFSWWTVAAVGCVAPRDGSPRIELCAGPELGHLAGHGFGLAGAHDAAEFRFGFQAMAEVLVPISARLRLRAGLGAATAVLGRHDFYIDGFELHHPQLVAGRAALGADFIF